jgi:type II restriction/modification system DNA methylase subunit YeeA
MVQYRLASEIQSTDREIDRLVYELYGLTEDEIKIVEGE